MQAAAEMLVAACVLVEFTMFSRVPTVGLVDNSVSCFKFCFLFY